MVQKMLEGVKILDFTNYLPGPFATRRLGDLGAEVIKVEAPSGDPARHTGVKKDGTGVVYLANNTGKNSIFLNLKEADSLQELQTYLSTSDVMVESFRPGVMTRLGIGYEEVKKINPDIIYCSIYGYRNEKPWSLLGSHDINYMALSGVLAQMKDANGKPIHPAITFADYFGSMAACEKILAALLHKERTGKGSYHAISLTDCMTSIMGVHTMIQQLTGEENGIKELNGELVCYGLYETADGRYMALGALEEEFWRNFCKGVQRDEWIPAHFSPRRTSNLASKSIEELFRSKSFSEWMEFSSKVDCCLTPVLEVGELAQFPYYQNDKNFERGNV